MYYVLSGYTRPHRWITTLPKIPNAKFWTTGHAFEGDIPNPIEVTMDSFNPAAVDSNDDTTPYGPDMPDVFLRKIPLFSGKLVKTIRDFGVDNLQLFRATIIDPDSGTQHEYVAVNLLGLIRVDDSKTCGPKLFRLAESPNGIIVHQSLKDHLIDKGFHRLVFDETQFAAL